MSEDTPTAIKGKDLEELVLFRARSHDEPKHIYSLGRYGVMATFNQGEWRPIKSLPDFEGVLNDGRQFIFDSKVCSQASYDMSGGTHKSLAHQLKHLRRRARFGVTCFLLMHFNERVMKTKTEPAFTVLFPVGDTPFWEGYDRGEQKKITRAEAALYGTPVEWNTPGKKRKASPDLAAAMTLMNNSKKETGNEY